jgi:hypothetical protein
MFGTIAERPFHALVKFVVFAYIGQPLRCALVAGFVSDVCCRDLCEFADLRFTELALGEWKILDRWVGFSASLMGQLRSLPP